MVRWIHIALLLAVLTASGCTFINEQSFEIDYTNSKSPVLVMNEVESYFRELGFKLTRKTHITYPKDERRSEFYIGMHSYPIAYTAYDHVCLRLDDGEKLYIDWVRISDFREKPQPGCFDEFYRKMASKLQNKIGVTVIFRLMEKKDEP